VFDFFFGGMGPHGDDHGCILALNKKNPLFRVGWHFQNFLYTNATHRPELKRQNRKPKLE
jgi:hypothetical protein